MYWKSFKISDLFFYRQNQNRYHFDLKIFNDDIKAFNDYDEDSIALFEELGFLVDIVTFNGKIGTIVDLGNYSSMIQNPAIIFSDYNGRCTYCKRNFIGIAPYILEPKNLNFWSSLKSDDKYFISLYISKIFKKKKFQNIIRFTRKDVEREYIILPVRECNNFETGVWTEDDGTDITIDTGKISEILEKINKELKGE